MKRVQRLARIEKKKLFTQKQAQELSGFSRARLITWEDVEIVMPDRQYALLYTWNQVILLRILYYLRQRWTLPQVLEGFKNSKRSIDEILEILPKSVLVNFGEFGIHPDTHLEIQVHNLCNAENDIQEKRFRNLFARESFPFIDNRGRQTEISVPKVIDELKALAKEKEVADLELKICPEVI